MQMKNFLLLTLAVLLALPLMAQTGLRHDGLIFRLYSTEGGAPYAEVIGNLLTEPTAVTIPSTVSKDGIDYNVIGIADKAFESCAYLTSVTIPNSVTKIGEGAFRLCHTLTSVSIPNSVTEIGNAAFYCCCRLPSVTIPNSVTKIGNRAFYACETLTSMNIPNSVIEIGASAFKWCSALTSVTIPNSVTSIAASTFESCNALTSMTIPNYVTEIGEYAFASCSGLTSVNIPASVRSIGNKAFSECNKLVEINYSTIDPAIADRDVFSNNSYKTATLNVAIGGLDKAYSTSPWMYFLNIQEKDFTGIEMVMAELDPNVPVEIFGLSGTKVADTTEGLPAGLYIIRQGKISKKVAVK